MLKYFSITLILLSISCNKQKNEISYPVNLDSLNNLNQNYVTENTNEPDEVFLDSINQNDFIESEYFIDSSNFNIDSTPKIENNYQTIYDYQMKQLLRLEIEKILIENEVNYWNNRPDYTSKVLEEYEAIKNKIELSKPEYNIINDINPNHNPDLIDVRAYEKSNGTVVEGHVRTRANNTIKDNLRY
ncbi:hypothetical protein ACFFUE_10415 [Bergeyella porcorum]|uniref:hypothetical protein n=1 Tax=Bergeyella porcorum TaxID=1735111 RepID=UPI0035E90FEC